MYDPFNKNAHGNRSHFRTMRKRKSNIARHARKVCKIDLKMMHFVKLGKMTRISEWNKDAEFEISRVFIVDLTESEIVNKL